MTTRLLYDRKTAAEQVSLSVSSLDFYIARGEFPNLQKKGSKILIPHADLVRFARKHHPGPIRPTKKTPQAVQASGQSEENAA
jgi:hypothetical protein